MQKQEVLNDNELAVIEELEPIVAPNSNAGYVD
jgi:hypothetical protein